MTQKRREDEKRDAIREALRAAVERHLGECGEQVDLRRLPNEHALDAFLEALERRDLAVDEAPPRHYHSNGEAGDGQMVCAGCLQAADEPHAWSECAAELSKEVDAAITYAIELESQRDQARAHAESLRQELAALKGAP